MSAVVSLVTGMCPRWGSRWQRIRLRVSRTVDADQSGDAAANHRCSRSATVPARSRAGRASSTSIASCGRSQRRLPWTVRRPSALAGVGVQAEVDAQLPRAHDRVGASIQPSSTPDHRAPTGRPDVARWAMSWTGHGQPSRPWRAFRTNAETALLTAKIAWSGRRDSNPRPSPWQGDALPAEPRPREPVRIATPTGRPSAGSRRGQVARTLTARATTRAIRTTERVDWTIIVIFAGRVRGMTSVGLNAVAFVKAR